MIWHDFLAILLDRATFYFWYGRSSFRKLQLSCESEMFIPATVVQPTAAHSLKRHFS